MTLTLFLLEHYLLITLPLFFDIVLVLIVKHRLLVDFGQLEGDTRMNPQREDTTIWFPVFKNVTLQA